MENFLLASFHFFFFSCITHRRAVSDLKENKNLETYFFFSSFSYFINFTGIRIVYFQLNFLFSNEAKKKKMQKKNIITLKEVVLDTFMNFFSIYFYKEERKKLFKINDVTSVRSNIHKKLYIQFF